MAPWLRVIRLGARGGKPLLRVSCLGPLRSLPLLVRMSRLGLLHTALRRKRRYKEGHRQDRRDSKLLHGPNVARSPAP